MKGVGGDAHKARERDKRQDPKENGNNWKNQDGYER